MTTQIQERLLLITEKLLKGELASLTDDRKWSTRTAEKHGSTYVYIDFPDWFGKPAVACWALQDGEPSEGNEFEALAKQRVVDALEDIRSQLEEDDEEECPATRP